MLVYSFRASLLVLLFVLASVCYGESAPQESLQYKANEYQRLVTELEKGLSRERGAAEIDRSWQQAKSLRNNAERCVNENSALQEKLKSELRLLGEPVTGEDKAITSARSSLERDKQEVDLLIASCRLVLLKSETVLEQLEQQRASQQKRILMQRFAGVFELAGSDERFTSWQEWVFSLMKWQGYGWEGISTGGTVILSILLLVALVIARMSGAWFDRYIARHRLPHDSAGADALSFVCALKRYRYWLIISLCWTLFWLFIAWQTAQLLPVTIIGIYLSLFFVFLTAIRTYINPIEPARYHLPYPEITTKRLGRIMVVWAGVTCAGAIVQLLPLFEQLGDLQVALLRLAYLLLYVVVLASFVWSLCALGGRNRLGIGRLVITLVLVTALLFEIMGYRSLSTYLVMGVTQTFLLILAGWFVSRLAGDFYDSLDEGRYRWQKKIRALTGLGEVAHIPGLFWLRILTTIMVWGGVAMTLLIVWEIPQSKRLELLAYLTEGMQIGEVNIVPLRILFALVMLSLLVTLISWTKRQMEERWLLKSHLDAGARNAIVSISGYVIGALAIVITLGFAGVDLGNLAIIAGALSVGIGFGLQNIVNNFVSGLILLFERPIRKGDWIVVGNTEGYVEDISIRSTQIRTFDRADVIVPNSELISTQVTNWMLTDLRGRVKAPVGVAYGSDVQRVKQILLDIAYNEPLAILDGSVSEPKVLFLGFGDSSLNFELRFFIRDVDQRLTVVSNVNFAIDSAFRENGIEIPFPQRDLHLRSVSAPAGETLQGK